MKKKLLGAAVTAALMAGNAYAALPTIDPATTTVVYLAGSSASLDYLNKLITTSVAPVADRFCDTNSEIWKFNDTINGKTQNAFYCTKSANNPGLANAKSHILVYKRSEGGSDMGVAPVVANTAINFLNITSNPTCTVTTQAVPGAAPTIGVATCAYDSTGAIASQYTLAKPSFGMSDVDPTQFRKTNVSAGFNPVSAADAAKLTVKAASTVMFGEPVTLKLYNALQAAQIAMGKIPATVGGVACQGNSAIEACMPNLTSREIASLHSGAWIDWNEMKVVVGGVSTGLFDWVSANAPAYLPDPAAGNVVHICRRVPGSGTQTQHGIHFLNTPCADAADATPPAIDSGLPEGFGVAMVHEMSTSGGVSDCLKSLDTGTVNGAFTDPSYLGSTRWAVGLQSLENSGSFEYVKIDGVAPTLAHVADGSYLDWVENTFQYNTVAYNAFSADVKALVDSVIATSGAPEVMAALNANFVHNFGNGAYLAVPTLFSPVTATNPNGSFDSTRPVNPYSHAVFGSPVIPADNCRVPTIYNSGNTKL
ncbi:MAG: hypothetical protein PHY54_02560 [Methylococcales bacterium]|nr:hypothetical protein [Methylococcales bacterium]